MLTKSRSPLARIVAITNAADGADSIVARTASIAIDSGPPHAVPSPTATSRPHPQRPRRNPGNAAAERGKPWELHEAWKAQVLATTRGTMEMFALHDYDGDGTPELHSANYRKNLPLEVWRWTKTADGSPALTPFVLGAEGGGHGFAWGDVNGDRREDVLTEIGWYERPAGDPFARPWKLHPETELPHPSCPLRRPPP